MPKTPKILAIDAGGTMTDTFIIDEKGDFVVGKAQTTPQDESIGFMRSAEDALGYWDLQVADVFPVLKSGIYSGTAMLNRLLERKGVRCGIIVTAGMEDYLRLERAIQTYLGYSYSDRLHIVTHRHNVPLVPRERIFGVRERVDVFGKVAIPLYEHEVRTAVENLLAQEVKAIVVNLIYSFKNPAHESRIREIATEVMEEKNVSVPIYLSSELYPLRQDFPRLNATLLEAYAAEPSRVQLQSVRATTRASGAKFDLRIMASHGGTISIDSKELGRTLVSGPIGGVVGARYLAERLGTKNVACTDIGGTSFDIALITDGDFEIKNNPDVARFLLNTPLVQIDSLGAGTGSYARINPSTNRIEIGPDSAGSRIGVCYPDGGVDTVTISDCNVVLGILNPHNFLGGDVVLDKDRAHEAVKTQIADKLRIDVYEAAAGVVSLFEDSLKNALLGRIVGKGYGPENYTLLSYGGGGPVHVGGYSEGLPFEEVLIPSWAPGFSAFGCACGDFEYRFEYSVDLPFLPGQDEATIMYLAGLINQTWDNLQNKVLAEFAKSGVEASAVKFKPAIRMQYYGQLNDLEFPSPVERLQSVAEVEQIQQSFNDLYGKIYYNAAKTPEYGYLATRAIMTGVVDRIEKPELPDDDFVSDEPVAEALKETRQVYWRGTWHEARIYHQDRLQCGNVINGMAIIEAPASTTVIPPNRQLWMDKHRIMHLTNRPQNGNGRA